MDTKVLIYIIIFGIYVVHLIWLAREGAKKTNSSDQFFMGNRRFGSVLTAGTYTGTALSPSAFLLGPAGLYYVHGWSWSASEVAAVLAGILGLGIVSKKVWKASRKTNAASFADLLSCRYDSQNIRLLIALIIVIFMPIYIQAQLMASAYLLGSMFGVPFLTAVVVMAALIGIYTIVGGYTTVVISDAVQVGLMLLATIFIIPVSLSKVGGLAALNAKAAALNPALIAPPGSGTVEIGFWMILFWFLTFGFGYIGTPQLITRLMTMENTKVPRHTLIFFAITKAWFIPVGIIMGLTAKVLYPNLPKADMAFSTVATQVFHPVLGGILMVGLIAAMMSTVDSLLILASQSLSVDIIQVLRKNPLSDQSMLKVGRWVTAAVITLGAILALAPLPFIKPMVSLLVAFSWSGPATAFTLPVLLGLFWKRATKEAAMASIILSTLGLIFWQVFYAKATGIQGIIIGFAISLICMVGISLITKAPPQKVIDIFFKEDKIPKAHKGAISLN